MGVSFFMGFGWFGAVADVQFWFPEEIDRDDAAGEPAGQSAPDQVLPRV